MAGHFEAAGGLARPALLVAACVVYIPGVRDAFNLASLIADTNFVDKPYDRTEIGDDVQLVELASNKFHYPEGYFAPKAQTPGASSSASPNSASSVFCASSAASISSTRACAFAGLQPVANRDAFG